MQIIMMPVSQKRWEKLRELINEIDGPHTHHEGQNECSICDEELVDSAIRLLQRLKAAQQEHQ